jgi:hypothetical protein
MDGGNDNEPSLGAPALNLGWAEEYDQTAWGMAAMTVKRMTTPSRRLGRPSDIRAAEAVAPTGLALKSHGALAATQTLRCKGIECGTTCHGLRLVL